jgi:hypothetical protein
MQNSRSHITCSYGVHFSTTPLHPNVDSRSYTSDIISRKVPALCASGNKENVLKVHSNIDPVLFLLPGIPTLYLQ